MAVSLLEDFNRVEDETIKKVRQRSGYRHAIPVDSRKTFPVRLESWYRSPAGETGWTVSYVEAVRQYPPGPEDKGCGLETLVSGWLHHRDGKLVERTELRGKLTYCDRVGATYMFPFGRIRPKDQTSLGISALRLGVRVVRGRVGPSGKDPLRPRSLRGAHATLPGCRLTRARGRHGTHHEDHEEHDDHDDHEEQRVGCGPGTIGLLRSRDCHRAPDRGTLPTRCSPRARTPQRASRPSS